MTYVKDNTYPASVILRDAGLPTKTLIATFNGQEYAAEREGDELRVFLISDGQIGSVAVSDADKVREGARILRAHRDAGVARTKEIFARQREFVMALQAAVDKIRSCK